jgi:CDP-diacylglycerol--serine O-phosphatidyltransferase
MAENKITYYTIPNFITSLNLLAGSLSVFLALSGEKFLIPAAYLIGIAALFDFLDGMSARLLKAYSEIGKQLDSLADLVSFGVAPAAILFQMLKKSQKIEALSLHLPFLNILILSSAALIIIFSAWRLAKFNIDQRQSDSFIGMPTPAVAIFIASLPIIKETDPGNLIIISKILDINLPFSILLGWIALQVFVLESIKFFLPVIVILSFLLVSEFPMFSLKFKNMSFKDNRIRYIFLMISFILIIFLQFMSIPFIIITFAVMSGIKNISDYRKLNRLDEEIEDGIDEMDDIGRELKSEFKLFEEDFSAN